MRIFIFIFFLIVLNTGLKGQTGSENLTGNVSFISSRNIYVKFNSTKGISIGDTLFRSSSGKLIPILKVDNLSSTSCICTSFSDANPIVSDEFIARIKTEETKPVNKINNYAIEETRALKDSAVSVKKQSDPDKIKQNIRGSVSAYSYSGFSNTASPNSTRFRYTFSFDGRNIGNSKFSVENYISFNHKHGDWNSVKSDVFSALKIYSLSVRYDLNNTTQISLGRKINPKISSIGAMDGLQIEKTFKKIALGVLAGTRPDYKNYGFDSKLFQYGAYLSFNTKSANLFTESSLAFMEQMNGSKTDRRFLYFQHSNSLVRNINFFSTFEVDLFKIKNDLPQNTFDLTGLYLSLRYKMLKNFTLTGSYDARKNVMYYETFKSYIDQILETEMRQSLRLQADYRITKDLTFGLQSGYRFLKSDPHPSKNLYGYLTYYQIPGLKMSVTLTGTYLESNYINSKILGATISRDLFKGKFQTSLGYRYTDYRLTESPKSVIQNIGEINLYWQLSKNISFSANYEGTTGFIFNLEKDSKLPVTA
jgi:hypothetical protein